MYLKTMRINEGVGTCEEIRCVQFKTGLNIIVDETEGPQDGKGNNVGKTTFLKLIDICFGATDKKYIWTDYDTGSETTAIKKYINEKKVSAELDIETRRGEVISLRVDLYERGKRYINGEIFSQTAYFRELNRIIFGIEAAPPTFRQLIGKFVRIKQKGDDSGQLRYLHPNTTKAEYKNIYEFLFKLSDPVDSAKRLELSKEIAQAEKEKDEILRLHKLANVGDLEQRIRIVQNAVSELESQIDIVRFGDYQRNTEAISRIHGEIVSLNDAIDEGLFKRDKIERILESELNSDDALDWSILESFYKDVTGLLGRASKTFEELIAFNQQIKQNKIRYYRDRLTDINSQVEKLLDARKRIISQNKHVIGLVDENNFETFEKTYKELMRQSELLGELKKVRHLYDDLTEKLSQMTDQVAMVESRLDFVDNLSRFIEYLTRYSNEVLGQRLYLTAQDDTFPLKLSNVDDGLGTGHRKTMTLLLDIAYVSLINELDLDYPRFFVHDVLETIDEHNFRKVVRFIKENKSQFVCAILNEKIRNYPFVDEQDKILRLSREMKLFKR